MPPSRLGRFGVALVRAGSCKGLNIAVLAGLASVGAQAQDQAAQVRVVDRLQPSLGVTETLTDNYQQTVDGAKDAITRLSAGLRATSQSGRLRGHLDYTLMGILYARHSEENNYQNYLNASANAELVENWAFLDASATLGQSYVSAFGKQVPDASLATSNIVQTGTLRIAPVIRGRLGSMVAYEALVSEEWYRASGQLGDQSATTIANLQLGSTGQGRLGWSATARHAQSNFDRGRDTQVDRLFGAINGSLPDYDLAWSATLGVERSNVVTLTTETTSTYGGGIVWAPSPRTKLTANYEERFYGPSYSVNFEHRRAKSMWQFTHSRNISFSNVAGGGQAGTAYDLYFAQFAALEPDPALRAQLVNDFLRANGIQPNSPSASGFLTQGATINEQETLAFSLLGVRNTATLSLSYLLTQQPGATGAGTGDLSLSNFVRRKGVIFNLAHHLTPDSTLTFVASADQTTGDTSFLTTSLEAYTLLWSHRLGKSLTGTVSARRNKFNSQTTPYTENAISASANMQF